MVVDPSLDSSQRIAVLQQKLSELRKAYADVKAELATVERRRKKLRRREREGNKPYRILNIKSQSKKLHCSHSNTEKKQLSSLQMLYMWTYHTFVNNNLKF